jgi:ABC-type sugar transport system ATPase subunit
MVQQVGDADAIFNRPRNVFIARIMGYPQINLIESEVRREGDRLQLVSTDGLICVEVPKRLQSTIERTNLDTVLMGARPMYMSTANGSTANTFDAKVYVYERLGTKGVLTTEVNGRQLDVLTPIEHNFEIDSNVRIAIDPNQIMVFDPTTEENVIYTG